MYHPCGLMGSPSTEHLYCRHRGRGLTQLAAMLLLSPGPCLEDAGADQGRDGQESDQAPASHGADGQVLAGQSPKGLPGLGAKGLLGLTSQDQAGQGSRGQDAGGRDPGARGSQDVGGAGSTRSTKGQEATGRGADQNAVPARDPQQYLTELELQLLSNLRSGSPAPHADYEIGRGRPSAADMAPRYAYTPGFYGLGHPDSGYHGPGYRVSLTSDSYTYVR